MEQIHYKDPVAAERIQRLFKSSHLIPFFGSGFTKGERAKKGRVPDAKELVEFITDAAASRDGLASDEAAQIKSITKLKNAFNLLKQPARFSKQQARKLLENIFSDSKVADAKKLALLKLEWPHIFTFNVDDAIERNVKGYKVLSPNKQISREYIASNPCIFKIHGDISEFLKYEDYNLVFTWRDYAHSIESNKAMLSFLSEEAARASFMFVGCSLDAEIDLLHLTQHGSFGKSFFLKRNRATIDECLTLEEYGIEQVIYFDEYAEIANWIVETLTGINREIPFRGLDFDDGELNNSEAIQIVANGGALSRIEDGVRIARTSKTFPMRSLVPEAMKILRKHECLLVSGRRFTGKTMFLFQLIESMKEYGATYFGSSDIYSPSIQQLIRSRENHLFVFDSNYLDVTGLEGLLRVDLHSTSKIIICTSLGDIEMYRNCLEDRSVNFAELKLSPTLDDKEKSYFNKALSMAGLPIYQRPENLLTFAYRYYGEFRSKIKTSTLFARNFDAASFSVLVLLAGLEKADASHIATFNKFFDAQKFVRENERIFEFESNPSDPDFVLVCNSSAWLLTELGKFVKNDPVAISVVSNVVLSLFEGGFTETAGKLIRFDKLNEFGNGADVRNFIRGVYASIASIYKDDLHYWLQRAKSELIAARNIKEVEAGMVYASKVRLDVVDKGGSTYFSATLVLAQLYARSYRFNGEEFNLLSFLDYTLESARNYINNRRHVDKLIKSPHPDFEYALTALGSSSTLSLLARKSDVQELLGFFENKLH